LARRGIRSRYETPAHRTPERSQLIQGAEPVSLDGGPRGLLILHGFGDTPQSVRALATVFHEKGWTVSAPVLRGHGSSLRSFIDARASEWLSDARNALEELRTRADRVALIGQSMGGALATILASQEDVEAMVLLAPFVRLSNRAARIAFFHRLVSPFVPYLRSRSDSSILDPVARSKALGRGVTTPRLLHELSLIVKHANDVAPSVHVPTLVIHSRKDPRVTTEDAEAAFARLASPEKVIAWAERSGHVLSVDYDREWIASEAVRWIESHMSNA